MSKFAEPCRIVADDEAGPIGGVVRPHQRVARMDSKRDDAEPCRDLLSEQLTGVEAAVFLSSPVYIILCNWFARIDFGENLR